MAIPYISPNSDCVRQLCVNLEEVDYFLSRKINSRNSKLYKLEQEKKSLIIKLTLSKGLLASCSYLQKGPCDP